MTEIFVSDTFGGDDLDDEALDRAEDKKFLCVSAGCPTP